MDNLTSKQKQALALHKKHKDCQLLGDPTGTMEPKIYGGAFIGAITTNIVISLVNGDTTLTKSSISAKVQLIVQSGPSAISQDTQAQICGQMQKEKLVAALLHIVED
jgi:hypothetical protein